MSSPFEVISQQQDFSVRNIQFQIFLFIYVSCNVKELVTSNACLLLSYIVSDSGLATMGLDLVSFYPRFQKQALNLASLWLLTSHHFVQN